MTALTSREIAAMTAHAAAIKAKNAAHTQGLLRAGQMVCGMCVDGSGLFNARGEMVAMAFTSDVDGETREQAATREAQKHLDLVKSHGGKVMQSYRNKIVHLADCRAEFKTLDVTSQQSGFGGDGYLLTMDDGSERMLRGPWHGGAPDGFVEITAVDVEQDRSAWLQRKPWHRRGGTGTYITEDLFLRIVAAHQPHVGVARVGHKYGARLEPFNLDWDMPKALAYSVEHQRAQRGEPAGKHWRLYWDGSERYCGSLRIPTHGFLPEVTDLPTGARA